MSLLKYISIGACLLALSSAAFAFQEQKSGSQASPTPSDKAVDLATPSTIGATPALGTEVRIPGLGKLGNLPKMDFGLELLYGATETKQPEAQPRDETRDDLTIRGSVKHQF